MKILDTYLAKFGKTFKESWTNGQSFGGVFRNFAAFFSVASFCESKEDILFICPSNREAEKLRDESLFFTPFDLESERPFFLPGYENIPYSKGAVTLETLAQRFHCLNHIRNNPKAKLIFSSADAFLRKLPQPTKLNQFSIQITKEQNYEPEKLLRDLINLGYTRTERVELPGEICRKGSIIDIYPIYFSDNMNAVNEIAGQGIRIDYFDDVIETIALFDLSNQRTIAPIKSESVYLFPCAEYIFDAKELVKIKSHTLNENIISNNSAIQFYYGLVAPTCSLLDYFPKPPLIFFYPSLELRESFSRIQREFLSLYGQRQADKEDQESQLYLHPDKLIVKPSNIVNTPIENKIIDINISNPPASSSIGLESVKLNLGKMQELRKQIVQLIENENCVLLGSQHQNQLQRLAAFFENEPGLKTSYCQKLSDIQFTASKNKKILYLCSSSNETSFSIPEIKFYFLADAELFGTSYKKRKRVKQLHSNPISSFLDIKEGSYVVHLVHGIGRFIGLKRVKTLGKERDFLYLEYANEDKLYVPLDQISIVQQYLAPTEKPRLDFLGKNTFSKTKEKVQKKIEELAAEIIRLQAVRSTRKGYKFPKDTPWQRDFEEKFSFEETPDQLSAIASIKEDMESTQAMDRLICGDVGYGKTEVAIRAAFKATMAGRQVALLSPTTILAWQHYKTLKERFASYPVRIDLLSRFRSKSEARQIKLELKNANLDIIVGTHALLAKDVQIKNLGLLIVDEEQRFGVVHKEAIKRLRNLVDVLSLSATPIPRTLHMSLIGIRDLSIIETPPQERKQIDTYVMEDKDSIIRQAILKEKERDGQIFYLHNRIMSIERTAERISKLVPELSLAVLHGKMHEDEIEDVLLKFQDKFYDILVTTSIIENGIDMPNVNTLIVDRADAFGLSQLYQIRGRVGRSSKQAYAYFLFSEKKALTDVSQNRLNAILEYQELGSGFKISMRDLEIRGAGNILGQEQSGNIIDVGYELYLKLLQETIKKLKGESIAIEQRCTVHIHSNFFISEKYIRDIRQRIEFYKRFAAITFDDFSTLTEEMKERFGAFDSSTKIFVRIEELRVLAEKLGITSIKSKPQARAEIRVGEYFTFTRDKLIRCIQKNEGLSLSHAYQTFQSTQNSSASVESPTESPKTTLVHKKQESIIYYQSKNQGKKGFILEELMSILKDLNTKN